MNKSADPYSKNDTLQLSCGVLPAPYTLEVYIGGSRMAEYAHPEALVSTEWVAQHSKDANVRVVEVDVDTTEFSKGHVPGAIAWNWTTQLADTVRRDILSKAQFEKLMNESGISNNTTVILYGDNNNWFAAWALWQMKMYGHNDVRLMNGGS